ncbi:MAG: GtrA family protein [Halohasta sp.]
MIRPFLRNLIEGPMAVQLRRFVAVGTFAAGVQMLLLWLFVDVGGINYLIGATIAIELTIILSYVLNNAWTFQASQNVGFVDYTVGLLKTNVVRGTAIPIQLAILYVLVEWAAVLYLLANAIAILISGLYRYVLDARWTWG